MNIEDEKTGVEEGVIKGLGGFFVVGPLITLFGIAHALTDTVMIDLIVHRTCVVSLNVSAAECHKLRVNAGSPEAVILEAKVEPHTGIIVLSKSLIEIILPAVITLLLGSWSDRFGRRPLFLVTFYGLTLSCVMHFLMSHWHISPWYLLIALIPLEIVGSSYTRKLATDCYISDSTTMRHRSLNFALMKALDSISDVLGRLIGAFLYRDSGYTNVFGTAAICGVLGTLYTHMFVSESVKVYSKESKFRIITVSNVIDPFVSCITKRKGFNRPVAWLGIFCITISPVIGRGQNKLEFLFTRSRLGWDVQQYSYFSSVHSALQLIGLFGVLLRSCVSDTLLAGLSILSKMGAALTKSLAWKSWHMYLAMSIQIFNGLLRPVMRTLISKVVPAGDIGKIFALVTLLQLLTSFASTPLLTFFYFNYLPPFYPSPLFLLPTGLYTLLLISVIFMAILIRKSSNADTYSAAAQEDFYCSEEESEPKEDKQNTQIPRESQIRGESLTSTN